MPYPLALPSILAPLALFAALAPQADREAARFGRCSGPVRVTCVVDGDTFWYRGAKIRIADINAPEVSKPRCPTEARLGARATTRLARLLSSGRFTLQRVDRAADAYGRRLFLVTRAGESLGARLEAEGLARRWIDQRSGHWHGYRRNWC